MLLVFVGIAVFTIGIGALFAATADATGFVGLLPLFAVFAVLIVGAILLARKVAK